MKLISLLLLLFTLDLQAKDKFFVEDEVEIIKGFYEGCKGRVLDVWKIPGKQAMHKVFLKCPHIITIEPIMVRNFAQDHLAGIKHEVEAEY